MCIFQCSSQFGEVWSKLQRVGMLETEYIRNWSKQQFEINLIKQMKAEFKK